MTAWHFDLPHSGIYTVHIRIYHIHYIATTYANAHYTSHAHRHTDTQTHYTGPNPPPEVARHGSLL